MIRIVFPVDMITLNQHVSSVKIRAKVMLKQSVISEIPTIKVAPSKNPYSKGFSVIEIDCIDSDQNVWFGFFMGIDFCRDNLRIFGKE